MLIMSGLGHGYDLNHFYSRNKTYWFDMGEVRGTHKLIALKEQFDIYILLEWWVYKA